MKNKSRPLIQIYEEALTTTNTKRALTCFKEILAAVEDAPKLIGLENSVSQEDLTYVHFNRVNLDLDSLNSAPMSLEQLKKSELIYNDFKTHLSWVDFYIKQLKLPQNFTELPKVKFIVHTKMALAYYILVTETSIKEKQPYINKAKELAVIANNLGKKLSVTDKRSCKDYLASLTEILDYQPKIEKSREPSDKIPKAKASKKQAITEDSIQIQTDPIKMDKKELPPRKRKLESKTENVEPPTKLQALNMDDQDSVCPYPLHSNPFSLHVHLVKAEEDMFAEMEKSLFQAS